jgi:hypothetical protein
MDMQLSLFVAEHRETPKESDVVEVYEASVIPVL